MLSLRFNSKAVSGFQLLKNRGAATVISPIEQKFFPHIGNREIVGYGRNGHPQYYDDLAFPYPSIRFQANSEQFEDLRKKEIGDWNNFSLEEKKALYRHNFRQTFAEVTAPNPRWKLTIAYSAWILALGAVDTAPPNVLSLPEYKDAMMYIDVMSRRGPLDRYAYHWDIDQKKWKDLN